MSRFSALPEHALSGLYASLEACPPWQAIDASAALGPNPTAALSLLPRRVGWKADAHWAMIELASIYNLPDAQTLRATFSAFDAAVRRLHLTLTLASTDSDPTKRQAAADATALLLPDGLAPVNLRHDHTLDWAHFISAAASETLPPDHLHLLNLPPLLDAITRAALSLTSALGLSPTKPRDPPKSLRARRALTACQQTFKSIYLDLLSLHRRTPDPTDRLDLAALIAVFDTTLRRYNLQPSSR